jgi:hypothetical protein
MGFTPVLATPSELDSFLDPDDPVYGFAIDQWAETPNYVAPQGEKPDVLYQRTANADAFKQHGSPVAWHRYVTLGYYVYPDCADFEVIWRQFIHKQTLCCKMVWYNFMYHVDRQIDIPSQLQVWATEVARPHLSQIDPSYLNIDTRLTTWKKLLPHALKMDEECEDRPWTVVGQQKTMTDGDPNLASQKKPSRIRPPILAKTPNFPATKLSSLRTASSSKKKTPPKPSVPLPDLKSPPPPHTTPPPPPNVWKTKPPPKASDTNDVEMSQTGPTSTVQPYVATNDGTNRLTFRWKPKTNYAHLAGNKTDWLTEIHGILKLLFSDQDGDFYRWESSDLSQRSPISQLSPEQLRDYLSPRITSLDSHSTFVFGIRFSFGQKPPFQWRTHEYTKRTLADHGLGLRMSNSSSMSGRLVTAGYILFKAPNTTHRNRYLQSLRSQLPDNTPFFDINLHKRTPTDANYLHLVVECGENHVAPLTSALSSLLTGKFSAFFLPRLTFSKLSTDKIKKYFDMHQSYIRSLRAIQMSPAISNLDILRQEHFPDGTIVERSARAWATSLTLADGVTPLRCDVSNGSTDKQTNLLIPRQHYDYAKTALREYRLRLNILGERETRFRDSLPGLPSVILFDTSTQENLNFIEQLSSAEAWSLSPDAEKGSPNIPPSSNSASNSTPLDDDLSDSTPLWPPPASISQVRDTPPTNSDAPSKSSRDGGKARHNPQSDDYTAVSTRSESASIAAILARLEEFDKALQSQQSELKQVSSASTENFKHIETRLDRLGNLDETIIHRMEQHQVATMTAMKIQFEGMMAHMTSSTSAPGCIAPSPSSKRSHASTREASIQESPNNSSSLNQARTSSSTSMSTTSQSSNSSHARSPRQKKSTSIRTDMAHLDLAGLESDASSVLSDLGDLYSGPSITADDLSHTSDQVNNNSLPDAMQCDTSALNNNALPDSSPQYNDPKSSDGGDEG